MFFGPNHVLVKNCAAQSVFFFYTFLEVKNLNKLIKIAQILKKKYYNASHSESTTIPVRHFLNSWDSSSLCLFECKSE